MSSQLQINGSLIQSPPSVVGTTVSAYPSGVVPSSVSQEPIALTPSPKQSPVCTGLRHKYLNSPGSMQVLTGLGTNDDVTNADTLYLKSDAPILVQLTNANPAGGSPLVSIIPVFGTILMEFPTPGLLQGISAQGSANLSMLVSGPN